MQAFDGIRVLDLTHVLAGPFSTYQLAVLGADVIKIESPHTADMNREIGPVESLNDSFMGSHFQSQGGNKRAMTLNLKSEEGRQIFLSLARDADVIVENFRSGAMDRLGLSYADMCAVKPDIIYCSITGFGQTGPKRGHGAFDNVIQAYSGMMMATGHADGPAVMIGPPVLDYSTGAQAAFAISSALLRRERTGKGQRIDVAMLDAALMLMASGVLNVSLTGETPKRSSEGRDYVAAYGCFDTADEKLMLGVFTTTQHVRLWRALGREDLAGRLEGVRNSEMPKYRDHDEPILAEILKTRTADEWEEMLNEAGVPAARVRTLKEALNSEQVTGRSVIADINLKGAQDGTKQTAVAAFGCCEDGPSVRSSPAEIGEHTDEIIAGLGYAPDQVADLRRRGVV